MLAPEELARLRQLSEWKGCALVVHAWAVIFGAIALVALFPNLLTYILAVMLIGSRQLGLAILMHEGAHRCFSRNEGRNLAISQWFCAYPVFADTLAYRRYHLAHHAHTQQQDDPDLVLSAPFPITKASYRRKSGVISLAKPVTSRGQLLNALGDPSWPMLRRLRHCSCSDKLGPQAAVNALLFAGVTLAGVWWAYPLLWLLPLLTWMMVITRIRNIAEHAVVPDSDDPLRNTRTTKANLIERMFIAPYFVNYHLEHHLLFYVPCYNLPKLHALLMRGAYADLMEVQRGYLSVLKLATARPDADDRPGQIVNNARRMRGWRSCWRRPGFLRVLRRISLQVLPAPLRETRKGEFFSNRMRANVPLISRSPCTRAAGIPGQIAPSYLPAASLPTPVMGGRRQNGLPEG